LGVSDGGARRRQMRPFGIPSLPLPTPAHIVVHGHMS
jgi:hypothetical protein